jgi:hypothetical protein
MTPLNLYLAGLEARWSQVITLSPGSIRLRVVVGMHSSHLRRSNRTCHSQICKRDGFILEISWKDGDSLVLLLPCQASR